MMELSGENLDLFSTASRHLPVSKFDYGIERRDVHGVRGTRHPVSGVDRASESSGPDRH